MTTIHWFQPPDTLAPTTRQIVEEYWATTPEGQYVFTVKALMRRHGLISKTLTELVSTHGARCVHGAHCQDCAGQFVARTRTRYQELQDARSADALICSQCMEARQQAESQREQEEDVRRRAHLLTAWNGFTRHERDTPTVKTSVRHCILMLALQRARAHEDMTHFVPEAHALLPFAPPALSHALLQELWEAVIIGVHPRTPLHFLNWNGDQVANVDLNRVHLVIPGMQDGETFSEALESLESSLRSSAHEQECEADIRALKAEVYQAEVLAMLMVQLRAHHLGDFQPGEKTRLVMRKLMRYYSLGQAWKIIVYCVEKAAAAHARGTPRAMATNSVVTRIDHFIDRALAEHWTVWTYSRPASLPETTLSQVLNLLFPHITLLEARTEPAPLPEPPALTAPMIHLRA